MRTLWSVVFCVFLCLAANAAHAVMASESLDSKPVDGGQIFPDLALEGELAAGQGLALGIPEGKLPTTLQALKADALVIVVFSMYCPYCQREAPVLNELNELIIKRGLADRLKLIGIGAGNSNLEVDVYRKKYGIQFPLFSDQLFTAHKAMGNVGTPFYYFLKREADGRFRVADSLLGCMVSAAGLLDSVVKQTGVEEKK